MEDQLKQKLAQLSVSLKSEQALDQEDIQNLKDLDRDIKLILSKQDAPSHADMESRLEQQAIAFDGQYPQVSAILRDVVDILSKMGI